MQFVSKTANGKTKIEWFMPPVVTKLILPQYDKVINLTLFDNLKDIDAFSRKLYMNFMQ